MMTHLHANAPDLHSADGFCHWKNTPKRKNAHLPLSIYKNAIQIWFSFIAYGVTPVPFEVYFIYLIRQSLSLWIQQVYIVCHNDLSFKVTMCVFLSMSPKRWFAKLCQVVFIFNDIVLTVSIDMCRSIPSEHSHKCNVQPEWQALLLTSS